MRKKTGKKTVSRRRKQVTAHAAIKSSVISFPKASRLEAVSSVIDKPFTDLPFSYDVTKFVLLVRDPYWAYSYWDFTSETWKSIQKKMAEDSSLKAMIQVYDLDAKRSFDLLISFETQNWYLHLGTPDHRYVAELGMGDGNSRFYSIVRSNEVRTPRDSPSEVIDPEWSDRDFEEVYRLSGGGQIGISSPGSLFFPRQV